MGSLKYKVSVDLDEALRYMGVSSAPDFETLSDMRRLSAVAEKAAHPRVIIKELPVVREGERLSLSGSPLRLEGSAISALLHNSDSCVLFCATVGEELEALLRRYSVRDISTAAMLDACASSAVESLCNQVEAALRMEYKERGLYLTDRFSPGYGDFPIEAQRNFCEELDTARKIGVCLSESGIMIPRKSVTALMGVSNVPQKSRERGCEGCGLKNSCKFRESKVTCYGQAL